MATLTQNLRDTNRRLRLCLDGMFAAENRTAVGAPEHMAALLSELLQAGAWLRAEVLPARDTDLELNRELEKYRGNVEQLHRLLPSIHSQLLAERARLEAQRARIQSAAEWARASRRTL
jgi:hypothetical protein